MVKNRLDLSKKVMQQIQKEHLKMRPKIYFQLQNLGKKLTLSVLFLTLIYLFSIVIFKFILYRPFDYLAFGLSGFKAFWYALPWPFLISSTLTYLAFLLFLKNFDFFYKLSYRHLPIKLFSIVLLSGFLINATSLNINLRNAGVLTPIYHGVFITQFSARGKISEIDFSRKIIKVETPNEEYLDITWDQNTKLPNGLTFTAEDTIEAIGFLKDKVFFAKGIIKTAGFSYY